jgi:hypothetical protein
LWTQGVTRRRWFATTSLVAVAVAGMAGALYAAIAAAWLDTTNRVTDERFSTLYDLQGVVPVAASMFAVSVGIACGVALRRTLPALAATIGIFVVVRVTTAVLVRPRLATPRTLSVAFARTDPLAGSGAWELSNRTVDRTGLVLGHDGSLDISRMAGRCPGISMTGGDGLPAPSIVDQCLRSLDVRSLIRYQPGSRFWAFQLVEAVLLLGLGCVSLAVAHRSLDRRGA